MRFAPDISSRTLSKNDSAPPAPRVVKLAGHDQPPFAVRLQLLRIRKRFSLRALGSAAELSATYIRTLEQGYDPRTRKPVRPSVDVVRRIARALGDGLNEEAERIFATLMDAAGYTRATVREPEPELQPQYSGTPRPSSIEAIVEAIRQTNELSEEDKQAFVRLIERSRRIVRGERDPHPDA